MSANETALPIEPEDEGLQTEQMEMLGGGTTLEPVLTNEVENPQATPRELAAHEPLNANNTNTVSCWMTPFTKKFWLSASTPDVDWKFWAMYYVTIVPKFFLMGLNFFDLYRYASVPDWQFFFTLLATMLIPLIPINAFSYWWCKTDSKPKAVPRRVKIYHCLLLGYWWRQYRLRLQAMKVGGSTRAEDRHRFSLSRADLTFLSLMALYSSSAPQLVFKLYRLADRWSQHASTSYKLPVIGIDTTVPEAYQKVAFAVLTAVSLALSTISHAHASRQHRWDKQELSNASRLLQVLYRLLFLTSRVVALAFLFLLSTPVGWGICFILFLLLLLWFRWLKTEFCESAWQEWIYNIVLAYMHLFGVFNVKDTPARFRYLLYYTFSLLLEITIFICAIRACDTTPWLPLFVLAFVLGLVCHGVEHKLFHPPGDGEQHRWYIPRERQPWETECRECVLEQERAAPKPAVTSAVGL